MGASVLLSIRHGIRRRIVVGLRTRAVVSPYGGVFCYVIMEEISWGQRIIGFSTPEFFKLHNLQGEANLHNLITGPVDIR